MDKKEITMEIRKHFKPKKKIIIMNTIGLDAVIFLFGTMIFFFFRCLTFPDVSISPCLQIMEGAFS